MGLIHRGGRMFYGNGKYIGPTRDTGQIWLYEVVELATGPTTAVS